VVHVTGEPGPTVRYSVALPTDSVDRPGEFGTAAAVMEMAAAAEAAGFHACHVTDHPFPPARWVAEGGHHALDPLVTLAVAAAATSRIGLHTNVFVAGYRNPFLAAKGVATLDALSQGRVILGVAAGYLEGEFDALGAPFADRGPRLDRTIDAMKQAWTGDPVEGESDGWVARGNAMLPTPVSSPHPPIWIGGNARAAMRRAVARGQGWVPFPAPAKVAAAVRTAELTSLDMLAGRMDELRAMAEAAGRTERIDVCCTPFTHPHWRDRFEPEVLLDEADRLAAIGVTWLSIRLPAPDRAAFLELAERFGKEVIDA
jgi:probable F420-dependent oxidoreductase